MKNYLPEVKIGKITLREICETDYLDYYEIGCDFETTKDLSWGPFTKVNQSLWVIREIFYKRPLDGIPVGYSIVLDDKMIGVIDFHTYFPNENTAEIGYILNRAYWNQGIMKRCLKEMIKIGFYHLDLDKIIVAHTINNEASKHVIKACGFKYEYQKIINLKGVDTIAYYYAMYRYEYEGGLIK